MNGRFDLLTISVIAFSLLLAPAWAAGQQGPSPTHNPSPTGEPNPPKDVRQGGGYSLGPGDMLYIQMQNVDELSNPVAVFRIDLNGYVDVPRIGPVYAEGLTTDRLEAVLADRFRKYLKNPVASVRVDEFHSKPVSVLGSVGTPGVHPLQGDKTLLAAISEAGGLTKDAGSTINITRRKDEGPIPLPNAVLDPTGQFYVARVNVHDVIDATNPKDNIQVRPNDTITVPQGEVVYVIGAVMKSGGFTLADHQDLSVLEALSLASGLDKDASASKAKVLRPTPGSNQRTEIPVNVKKILAGKSSDVPLLANDILFIPNSGSKNASIKVLQALLSAGTGIAIYGPRY
jgi:polysaccharide export outer membrane protein